VGCKYSNYIVIHQLFYQGDGAGLLIRRVRAFKNFIKKDEFPLPPLLYKIASIP
jgi:hypothetical protein